MSSIFRNIVRKACGTIDFNITDTETSCVAELRHPMQKRNLPSYFKFLYERSHFCPLFCLRLQNLGWSHRERRVLREEPPQTFSSL